MSVFDILYHTDCCTSVSLLAGMATLRCPFGDAGNNAAPPSFMALLTVGLLCVNTIILLSDHRWLSGKNGLKQVVHWLEESHNGVPGPQVPPQLPELSIPSHSPSHYSRWEYSSAAATAAAAGDSIFNIFQQGRKCNQSPMMSSYIDMHGKVLSGEVQPHYLVSVAPETGAADRLTGTITQFYFALLSGRAFTAYDPAPDKIPSFAAACDFPLFNWTHPTALPAAVVEPLHAWHTYAEQKDQSLGQYYPAPYGDYMMLNWNNGSLHNMQWLYSTNISSFPPDRPDLPYLVSSSNRGATWKLASNPYHRDDFWRMGTRPEEAFMCGFFALCRPNAAVQHLYHERFWRPLTEPNTLKIGIQIRFGDKIMTQDTMDYAPLLFNLASPYFECARSIEQAYAQPGQKVIWYLLSDSGVFRRAAKEKFGAKLLTDTELQIMHTDCKRNGLESACTSSAMDTALQHSIGSILAFSLADYHIISKVSGFGRMGAWLSGKWNNLHEIKFGEGQICDPYHPIHPMMAAMHGSGV